jgi:hypothetical protein
MFTASFTEYEDTRQRQGDKANQFPLANLPQIHPAPSPRSHKYPTMPVTPVQPRMLHAERPLKEQRKKEKQTRQK